MGFRQEDIKPLKDAVEKSEELKGAFAVADDGTFLVSIDQVFARFIQRLLCRIDLKVLQEVAMILTVWRNSINNTYTQFETERF